MARNGVMAALFVGLSAALVVTVLWPLGCTAEEEGVQWSELSLDAALAKAKTENKRLFVEFTADWCPTCKQLEAEVLSSPAGAEVTAKVLPVRVDFDDEANRPHIERYVVLGLPTVVVLTPEGQQVGRVMGYEGQEQWLAQARKAVVSEDPVPALRAALKTQPDNAGAALRLGKALLVRGEAAEGEALLERVLWMAPRHGADGENAAEAAEALFVLGRYYQRVKRDPGTARHIWRELDARYPRSDWAGGALWWYARAQAELDSHAVGLAALKARAVERPDDVDALTQWGGFVVKYKLEADRDAIGQAIARRLEKSPSAEQRRELEELRTKLGASAAGGA